MDVRVKTKEHKMAPATFRYLDERLKSLEKLLGKDAGTTRCEVEIGRDAGKKQHSEYMWYAEIHIIMTGKRTAYARNTASSVNAAIDDVKEEVERQLRKTKKVGQRTMKKGGALAKKRLRDG